MFPTKTSLSISTTARKNLIAAAAGIAMALTLSPRGVAVAAPGSSGSNTGVVININNPQRTKYPLAVPAPAGGDPATGAVVHEVASFDMKVAGWFHPMDGSTYPGNPANEGPSNIDAEKWKASGAYGVMKYRTTVTGGRVTIDFRLYEVQKGDRPVLSRTYKGSTNDLRRLTHMWCNEVVKYYTGEPGFFGSQLTFATKTGKRGEKVMVMDFDGHGAYSPTRNSSINILPAWSPSGTELAFTSFMRDNPDLYVVGRAGGRPRRICHYYGMNTGATWSPDGTKIALTLSRDGQPEIYVIDAHTGKLLKRLTNNRAIDTDPAWSPDGKEIAFISDREGGPQIFVMNANGSNQRRVSMNGSYNTTPDWNPRSGTRQLAYTTRANDGGGSTFDIVTLDLTSGKMVRITQNEGVNEEPTWSPNGRVIAFASNRKEGSGIYLANADGTGDAIRVWKGWGTSLDWGPTPVQ